MTIGIINPHDNFLRSPLHGRCMCGAAANAHLDPSMVSVGLNVLFP